MSEPSPDAFYRGRLEAARASLARLDRQGAWLANFRGGTFAGALVAAGLSIYGRLPRAQGWGLVGLLLAVYVALAVWHQRVIAREERARLFVGLNERALARMSGAWRAFPGAGERFLEPAHRYAPDLDLFGQGSVFQLVDESATKGGEARLAAWFLSPAAPNEVAGRQDAVRELLPQADLRQELVVEARIAAKEKADPARFLAWAEGPPQLSSIRWARPFAWILPAGFAVTATLVYLDQLPSGAAWAAFVLLLLVNAVIRKPLAAMYDAIAAGEAGFVRFERVFAIPEARPFRGTLLQGLKGRLAGASPVMRAFSWRFAFAELRQNGQIHAIVQLFTLWDVHWLFALERWRGQHGRSLRGWFDALADLEALASLAGFAHVRPGFAFPEIVPGAPRFEASGLGHPLLDAPVKNDVALPPSMIVTGSNMSGKTTLLRTVGLNAVLGLTGAPVCADRLQMSPLQVLTGMRVKDSLERGVSYFFAEVQRLKLVLDGAKGAAGQALFLLDEMLLGTNARERQLASREVLRLLLDTGAIGAVATHDLTLASTELGGSVKNVHFEDQVSNGTMSFDYRLREGVVQGTNALRLLREAGIDVRE